MMNFDYEKLAKEIIKQMPGNVSDICLGSFCNEVKAYTTANRAKKTAEGVELVCKKLLKYFSPAKNVRTITVKDAEKFLEEQSKGAKKGIYNYHRVLRSLWNKGIEWNYLQENIFEKVKLPRRQKEDVITFTEEQQVACIALLRKKGKDVIADIIEFLIASAMRPAEALNLPWPDYLPHQNMIVIGNAKFQVKNKKIRRIPVTDRMKEIIRRSELRQTENGKGKREFIFSQKNGRKYEVDTISKNLKRVVRELGLPEKLHLYCCRATAATRWANSSVPIFIVSKMLGHSSPAVTQRFYAGSDVEAMRNILNNL